MSIHREKLKQRFTEEFNNLNEQQQLAVNQLEGPVMVIAGPGTGKTQILSARIAKILMDTDAGPDNILCLTYTEAGVVAMRKRLLKFIGPDAYKVNIYTYHAFCNDVIQENLSLFEKTTLDAISDLERIEMMKELIDFFPKNHPLKRFRGDVYYEIKNLQNLFSTMKTEGWSASFIEQKMDEYIADLPNRDEFVYKKKYKEFKAGHLKQNKFDEEVEKMEKLRAAIHEFDSFQAMMQKRNRYDFDDMINWVIKVFEENKNVLSDYQERFQYVLVDEFQDTSGTQNRLIELLINYWDEPNVFVVGDDDQSIFRFQGANVENMLSFANNYKDSLLTVVLTKNYRSTQPILDISKSLIDHNEERLVKQIDNLSKELSSSHPKIKDLKHPPVLKEYETQKQEIIDITLQVEKLIAQGTPPGKIGIIYKEHKYGTQLNEYFNLRNIPIYSKRFENLLEIPLAKKILLIMRYLAAEQEMPFSADEMLFELLHAEWFNIPAIEIAKITAECATRKYSDNPVSLRLLIHQKTLESAKDLFSNTLPVALKKASDAIEKLLTDVPNITLQHLFESVIREPGILKYIMLSSEKIEYLQVVTCLFDFIKEETHRNAALNLSSFMKTIDLMIKEGLRLSLVHVSGTDKGVNLMTTHGSKGLEFTHVFFVGCNANLWEKKKKPGGGYSFPDNLFSSALKKKDDEELRRLFYVALTRAEQHLQISWSKFKADGKEQEPSMFIAEILDQHELLVEKVIIDNEVLASFAALYFDEPVAPELEKIEADFVGHILDKFVMNVTALNNYLSCPLEFYFKNLIRIPSPKNEATEFGSAVHYALEQLFRKMQKNDNLFPIKKEFIEDFEWYMNRHRESFTNEQFKRRMEYGHEVLGNYYDTQVPFANKIVAIERNIRNVVVKNVPLKGKLDKLEFDGKNVNVVDYKSGNPDNAKDKVKPPNDKQPNGGDYWRQAVFYKILVDHYDQKDWKVVSTEFDFIEPDKSKKYKKEKLVIQPEDMETVLHQITTVWEKIQQRDFYTGCGKADCHWCTFVKTNNMAIALHEIETEDEEESI